METCCSFRGRIDCRHSSLQIRLSRGRRSRLSFLYRNNGTRSVRVNLFYNKTFARPTRPLSIWHGSYTARFDPDYSFEVIVQQSGVLERHWLHFDAKYRLDSVQLSEVVTTLNEDSELNGQGAADYEQELVRLHRQDDLFKMHTYRDGVLSSRGAYIIFPGDSVGIRLEGQRKNLFVRHPSAFNQMPKFLFPSVGAFDLCPGREGTQRATIREFLRVVFDAMYAGKTYTEESGFWM